MGDLPSLILAIATLISSLAAFAVSMAGLRKSSQNATKIEEVHKLTNGVSERLQTQARAAGQASGELKGRADQVSADGAAALARDRALPAKPTPDA